VNISIRRVREALFTVLGNTRGIAVAVRKARTDLEPNPWLRRTLNDGGIRRTLRLLDLLRERSPKDHDAVHKLLSTSAVEVNAA
jgi:hypothetical protein